MIHDKRVLMASPPKALDPVLVKQPARRDSLSLLPFRGRDVEKIAVNKRD
jgi:hypothetical protein